MSAAVHAGSPRCTVIRTGILQITPFYRGQSALRQSGLIQYCGIWYDMDVYCMIDSVITETGRKYVHHEGTETKMDEISDNDISSLRLSFAPMEGITTAPFRCSHHEVFGGADDYYAPFLNTGRVFLSRTRDRRDMDPEANRGIHMIPQLLSNNSRDFLCAAEKLSSIGYHEINLNLGCPSGTVVSRHRGAGFLEDTDRLDRFFEEVSDGLEKLNQGKNASDAVRLSVKTRLGMTDPEEACELIKIYNRYPLSLLIIHPRVQKEGYSGHVHMDVFLDMLRDSRLPVCYNGDILTAEDAVRVFRQCRERMAALSSSAAVSDTGGNRQGHMSCPKLTGMMIGRGAVRDPAVFRKIRGGSSMEKSELLHFLDLVLRRTSEGIPEEMNQLSKMKDIWAFLGQYFPGQEKELKKIRHARSLVDYQSAVQQICSSRA